jgi:lysophospholipase L1-like esterase
VLALILLLEGAIALALQTTPGSGVWKRARRAYYMQYERQIVQYLPECAEYDPELAYRMKPGTCRFRNREYDHALAINSLGTRDRESALVAPQIVVTGDSFAMGWGVAQSETVSAVLGGITGQKTLNAAVSSYGTAREMIGLRRLDLSAAHTLVIQYCENDFIENARFAIRSGPLVVMGRGEYETTVRDHLAATRYYPGKHVRRLLPLWWRTWRQGGAPPPDTVRDCALEAGIFLRVLDRAALRTRPLRVVVFEGLYTVDQRSCFSQQLAERVRTRTLPEWVAKLDVIDTSSFLTGADYYPLDEHLNASGYRKIAAAISELVQGD